MEEFYLDPEFTKRCLEAGIEIEDARYYCNEGIVYEFKSSDDLMKATEIYIKLVQDKRYVDFEGGYRFEVTNTDDVHHLFSEYPPDID